MDQSGGHQGRNAPLTVQGHCRQTHQEMCAGGAWQGELESFGERDALGEIFLLGLS